MRITEEIVIRSPPALVFGWIEDPRLAARWQSDVASYEITKEAPGRVGTEFRELLRDARGSMELRGRVTAWVPEKEMAFELEGRGLRIRPRYTLSPEGADGAATRLRVDLDVRVGGWLSFLVNRLARRGILRQLRAELERLRQLCER